MKYPLRLSFSEYVHVNDLWTRLVEKLGLEKSHQAVIQAIDLQRMHGNSLTIPVLFVETCGSALVNFDLVCRQTGLPCKGGMVVLLLSFKEGSLQLLLEF